MQIKLIKSPFPNIDSKDQIQTEFEYQEDGVDSKKQLIFSNNLCSGAEKFDDGIDSVLSFLIKFKATHRGDPPDNKGIGAIMLPQELEPGELDYRKSDNSQEAKDGDNFFFSSIHENHYDLHLKSLPEKILLIDYISQKREETILHFRPKEINDYLVGVAKRSDWEELFKKKSGWKKGLRKGLRAKFDEYKFDLTKEDTYLKIVEEGVVAIQQILEYLSLYKTFNGDLSKANKYIKKHFDPSW